MKKTKPFIHICVLLFEKKVELISYYKNKDCMVAKCIINNFKELTTVFSPYLWCYL